MAKMANDGPHSWFVAKPNSEAQIEEHKAKGRWGLSSILAGVPISVVLVVQNTLYLALTLGAGKVCALEGFCLSVRFPDTAPFSHSTDLTTRV